MLQDFPPQIATVVYLKQSLQPRETSLTLLASGNEVSRRSVAEPRAAGRHLATLARATF